MKLLGSLLLLVTVSARDRPMDEERTRVVHRYLRTIHAASYCTNLNRPFLTSPLHPRVAVRERRIKT